MEWLVSASFGIRDRLFVETRQRLQRSARSHVSDRASVDGKERSKEPHPYQFWWNSWRLRRITRCARLAATSEPVIDNPDDWKAEFNLTPDFIVGDPDDGEAIVEVFDRTAGLNFGENHLVPEEGTTVLTLDTHIAAHDLLEELRIKVERYSPIGLPMIIAVAVSGEAHRHDIFLKQALYGEHWVNDLADNMWSELHEYELWNSTSGPVPGSENVIGLLIIRDAFFAHTPTVQFHAASSHECPPYGLNWKEPASIGGLVHDTWLGTPCSVDVKNCHPISKRICHGPAR